MGGIEIKEKARLYLERLGLWEDGAEFFADAELLGRLQYAHVTVIPYENLDILAGKPLPVDAEGLFEKIVINGRGGYCFELNGCFEWLVRELGYKTVCYMSRFLRGEPEIPVRRHRVFVAECPQGRFVCDAAVGQRAPRLPLRLVEGEVQQQFGESYVLRREEFLGWVIYDLHGGEWQRFYSFTEEPQLEKDFIMPSYYCENSPDSVFNKAEMLSIKTADGRKTIDGKMFRIFSGESVIEERISSDERMKEVLSTHFNIKISEEM